MAIVAMGTLNVAPLTGECQLHHSPVMWPFWAGWEDVLGWGRGGVREGTSSSRPLRKAVRPSSEALTSALAKKWCRSEI